MIRQQKLAPRLLHPQQTRSQQSRQPRHLRTFRHQIISIRTRPQLPQIAVPNEDALAAHPARTIRNPDYSPAHSTAAQCDSYRRRPTRKCNTDRPRSISRAAHRAAPEPMDATTYKDRTPPAPAVPRDRTAPSSRPAHASGTNLRCCRRAPGPTAPTANATPATASGSRKYANARIVRSVMCPSDSV